jgi:hypothetical protein
VFLEDIQSISDLSDRNGFIIGGIYDGPESFKSLLIEKMHGGCQKPPVEEDAAG